MNDGTHCVCLFVYLSNCKVPFTSQDYLLYCTAHKLGLIFPYSFFFSHFPLFSISVFILFCKKQIYCIKTHTHTHTQREHSYMPFLTDLTEKKEGNVCQRTISWWPPQSFLVHWPCVDNVNPTLRCNHACNVWMNHSLGFGGLGD